MFTLSFLLTVIALFVFATAEPHHADIMQPIPGRYICELTGPDIGSDSQTLFNLLSGHLPGYEVTMPRIFDYSLFKGVTIQISRTARSDGDGNLLATVSTDHETIFTGVLKTVAETGLIAHVYPVHVVQRPRVTASVPANEHPRVSTLLPHKQTQVDRVHTELRNTGAGIKIGILDTGVDYMHPALGGGFGPGYKVRYGRDLVGDDYDVKKGIPPRPDADPMDSCNSPSDAGHGTHVSGIIAGKYEEFTGVAPDAILGMWRVFSCSGDSGDDVIVEALLEAYDTGVDLISLSLGDPFFGWPESVQAVVAARITAKGVPVIAAAANSGENGAFSVVSPGVGEGVFSVASLDNSFSITPNGHEIIPVTTRNLVSDFSSIGASYEIDFKPNIAAFGGYIYSTVPRALGSWAILSGTSMATPYVAGSVALYMKSLEGITRPTPAYILEQFQNYAYQTSHTQGQSDTESPYRQGAGLVQVYDTILQNVHIVPGGISFNDTTNMQRTHTLTITNSGNSVISYQLVNKVGVSVVPYGLSPSVYFVEPAQYGQDAASLTFSVETIVIQPGSSADITVTVTPPTTDPSLHIMYGGFIQFKDLQGQRDLTVPYIGIVGNQRELPIFGNGTPFTTDSVYLAENTKNDAQPQHVYGADDIFVFDRSKPESGPVFGVSLPNPTREILAPLYTENSMVIGFAFTELVNLPRSYTGNMTFTLQWDGTFTPSLLGINIPIKLPVLPGNYRIGLEALKWLGDPNNQNDRETWMSCTIQVQ